MKSVFQALATVALSFSLTFSGCGSSDGIERVPVSGKVTFEGEPIASGVIMFIPTGKGAPAQYDIKDGEYNSKTSSNFAGGVVVGPNQIQVMASRPTGKKIKNPDNVVEEEVAEYIPAKFNRQSTLSADVKKEQPAYDFDLTK